MCSVPYQNLIGTLNHAAVMTQPNISKVVQLVAQFSSNPGPKHWNVALCIVKYLNTTKDWVRRMDLWSQCLLPIWTLTMEDQFMGMESLMSSETELAVYIPGA